MESKGLYGKYNITKVDGTPTDPNAQYFVLRLDTDKHARTAIRAYANSIKGENYQLYIDIVRWLQEIMGNKLEKDLLGENSKG